MWGEKLKKKRPHISPQTDLHLYHLWPESAKELQAMNLVLGGSQISSNTRCSVETNTEPLEENVSIPGLRDPPQIHFQG